MNYNIGDLVAHKSYRERGLAIVIDLFETDGVFIVWVNYGTKKRFRTWTTYLELVCRAGEIADEVKYR